MAETFVFNIADQLLSKLGTNAFRTLCSVWGGESEREREKLESTVSTIRAVLLDAEEQQQTNHQLTDWLGKLKDALYDSEDLLDELQYDALESQTETHLHVGIRRKVRDFVLGLFGFNFGDRIKEIREKLDEIAAEKAKFHLTARFVDRCVVHRERETYSFVRASDVIGRDVDKENIVQLLMNPGVGESISIIPIVGIGGFGKTTLAKLVYNDERVVRHFELKMWVCVSEDFDIGRLTKEMINSATGRTCDDLTLMDQLQSCLRGTLDNKKFLLVLDDVWNDDRGKWVELKEMLIDSANGCKIIVTTRSQSVASVMGTIPPYDLKGLSHEDSLSLFAKWAFKEGEERIYPNLLKIGDEIVKKCVGVPLAIRTLGSLLYLKTDERDWMLMKDNDIWKLEQKENDILPVLKLSYDTMPSYLKRCFAYCSTFPKDYKFDNIELTYLWIAQGLIQPSIENQELEDISHQFLKELLSRSFFQDVEEYTWGFTFKMHDLVHDLALSVAQRECSIVNCQNQNISKKVRHVSFSNIDFLQEGFPRFLLELDNVRTILFTRNCAVPISQPFVETCISRSKYLRVLDLRYPRFEVLPSTIGNSKHLRYLCLCGNLTIKKLPNFICKLRNLQMLNLGGCIKLEEVPRDIGNLINLRCLIITTKQIALPEEGISRLNSLRFLGFRECENLKSLGGGMQCLTALRTLIIWNCRSLEESLPRMMKYLTALETLDIYNCRKLKLIEQEEDIQGFRLRLRSLEIYYLPQLVAMPQWLQGAANTLQLLRIIQCHNIKALPNWLQSLTALRKLEINGCAELIRRCEPETGEHWPKICHVPEITLDDKKIRSTVY